MSRMVNAPKSALFALPFKTGAGVSPWSKPAPGTAIALPRKAKI